MKRILTAEQMKRCDSYTIDVVGVLSRELMQRAADAAFRQIQCGGFDLTKVLCICGTGNNGGDGLATAVLLSEFGVNTEFFICGDRSRMTDECFYRYSEAAQAVPEKEALDLSGVTLVVDAILGIGLSGNVRGEAAAVIKAVAESGIPVVSLDIPSGINSDSGAVMGCAVKAELTVSFAKLKPGHIFYPGRMHCGKTAVAEIGIGCDAIENDPLCAFMPDREDVREMIPKRSPDGHKGTFGRLLVVAGSCGMCGAAYFSALGAYRSGAGLVEVFTVEENLPIIQTKLPEAIATGERAPQKLRERLRFADACVIGPGLGTGTDASRLVGEALSSNIPLLIDADGLNIIAGDSALRERLRLRQSPTVLTPHLGEMERLTGVSIPELQSDPIKAASDFALKYGVVCVMKSAVTVVSDGKTAFLNPTGCSGLAKGGSGDVLSGVIGAFLCGGCHPVDASVSGVYIHGKAGEIASSALSEYSLLATDIANSVGTAINETMK